MKCKHCGHTEARHDCHIETIRLGCTVRGCGCEDYHPFQNAKIPCMASLEVCVSEIKNGKAVVFITTTDGAVSTVVPAKLLSDLRIKRTEV